MHGSVLEGRVCWSPYDYVSTDTGTNKYASANACANDCAHPSVRSYSVPHATTDTTPNAATLDQFCSKSFTIAFADSLSYSTADAVVGADSTAYMETHFILGAEPCADLFRTDSFTYSSTFDKFNAHSIAFKLHRVERQRAIYSHHASDGER